MQVEPHSAFSGELARNIRERKVSAYEGAFLFLSEDAWICSTFSAKVTLVTLSGDVLLTRYVEADVSKDWTTGRLYLRGKTPKLLLTVGSFSQFSVARTLAEGIVLR